jgi:5'-nucleotidase
LTREGCSINTSHGGTVRNLVPVLLIALGAIGCPKQQPPVPTAPRAPVTLSIAALNDFHGALYEKPSRDDPTRALGGLPWLAGALDVWRAEDPDLIVLDGGDVFQGSWAVNKTHGAAAVEAFELMGVDAAAVGNHEFDYGPGAADTHPLRGALMDAAASADFHWLTANVYEGEARWAPEGIAPWAVIERKGVKLGVIGLTTTDTPQVTKRSNVVDLEFRDVVASVKAAMSELPDVDAIAVVGHLTGSCQPEGYFEPASACVADGEVGALLTGVPEIDVLVTGHMHTLMAARVGDTFVLQNRSKGAVLGRVDLVIGPDGVDADASKLHAPWPIEHTAVDPGCGDGVYDSAPQKLGEIEVTPSAAALELIERVEGEAGNLCTEIGCVASPIAHSRGSESQLGDLVTDALLTAFDDVDVALTNSGGLRSDVAEGPLRLEHVQAVMPFDNRLMLIELSGEKLLQTLTIGSSGAHGILQLAGATYAFDPERTDGTDADGDGAVTWETERLCAAEVAGQPIDPQATYRVVTTDFLIGGGDHLGPALQDAKILEEGPLMRDHLFEWFEAYEGCVGDASWLAERIDTRSCPTE